MKDASERKKNTGLMILAVLITPVLMMVIINESGIVSMSEVSYIVIIIISTCVGLFGVWIIDCDKQEEFAYDTAEYIENELNEIIKKDNNVTEFGIDTEISECKSIKNGSINPIHWEIHMSIGIEFETALSTMEATYGKDMPKPVISPNASIKPMMSPVMVNDKETIENIKRLNEVINAVLFNMKPELTKNNIKLENRIQYRYKTFCTSYNEYGHKMEQMRCMSSNEINHIKDTDHIDIDKITEIIDVPV